MLATDPPPGIRPQRLRGSRAKGKTYERKFGRFLPGASGCEVFSGQWIHFRDKNGTGYAQPDYFITLPNRIQLFECKLGQDPSAWPQMRQLYAPLLEAALGKPVDCILVCYHLRNDDGGIIREYREVRDGATWHWLDY